LALIYHQRPNNITSLNMRVNHFFANFLFFFIFFVFFTYYILYIPYI